ncbi:hypothetical protein EYF80_039332 [Liparis tanakae]|uniref:Uncharacterized protein n=1 Tax=Liparis tanakae TaxID=230148 RepID=A0A4Z2GC05_9TELE|nr:hypothetical protein EYF80_039332 [Liparis tanakae]
MRYCVGATSCQMQFLLGGYSLGQPGLVMEPFSLLLLLRNSIHSRLSVEMIGSGSLSPQKRPGSQYPSRISTWSYQHKWLLYRSMEVKFRMILKTKREHDYGRVQVNTERRRRHICVHGLCNTHTHSICPVGLTGAFVEFACLCDIPFAQPGPLANGRSHPVHIVARQDGVQEDAPYWRETAWLPGGSHGDMPINARHVQTEQPELTVQTPTRLPGSFQEPVCWPSLHKISLEQKEGAGRVVGRVTHPRQKAWGISPARPPETQQNIKTSHEIFQTTRAAKAPASHESVHRKRKAADLEEAHTQRVITELVEKTLNHRQPEKLFVMHLFVQSGSTTSIKRHHFIETNG